MGSCSLQVTTDTGFRGVTLRCSEEPRRVIADSVLLRMCRLPIGLGKHPHAAPAVDDACLAAPQWRHAYAGLDEISAGRFRCLAETSDEAARAQRLSSLVLGERLVSLPHLSPRT